MLKKEVLVTYPMFRQQNNHWSGWLDSCLNATSWRTTAHFLPGAASHAVKFFFPEYRLGHPEKKILSLSYKLFLGSKYLKNKLNDFEKSFTDRMCTLLSDGQCFVLAGVSVQAP